MEVFCMKHFKIFTSGKMGGLSTDESLEWRSAIEKAIRLRAPKNVELTFVNPPEFFDYDYPNQEECEKWEIAQLIDSDIVIVNLSNIKDSIGTHMEMGIIKAINMIGNKFIYVVGLGKENVDHPWISSSIFHKEETIEKVADYVCKYLLI